MFYYPSRPVSGDALAGIAGQARGSIKATVGLARGMGRRRYLVGKEKSPSW
jgi:hypothetical protein